jgi:hypothetical protein
MSVNALAQTPDLSGLEPLQGDFGSLYRSRMVAVSSVKFDDLTDAYQLARFNACLSATDGYMEAGVPQIVMVDPASDERVAKELGEHGAIVVPTPRPGFYLPYADGVRLVQIHAGVDAGVLKAESDKRPRADDLHRFQQLLNEGQDVIVGDRTPESRASMHPVQQATEGVIDATSPLICSHIPPGISGGVQVYSSRALRFFLQYEELVQQDPAKWENWKYLPYVPAMAKVYGYNVTTTPITVIYPQDMVAGEDNPAAAFKRYDQQHLMLLGMHEIGELVTGINTFGYPMTADRRKGFLAFVKSIYKKLTNHMSR